MPVIQSSVTGVLRERASLQPNDKAFTFVDYDQDWDGVEETLTWGQLYRRTVNMAKALQQSGSPGDRAVILAPQGLDYIVAFLGAMEAGQIAVPLAVPLGGVSDERVSSVLRDSSPSVVLTTSPVVDVVAGYVKGESSGPVPSLIEVDQLDLDGPMGSFRSESRSGTAYLQYTSGSTRSPAGVMISHRNLVANFEQIMADYFAEMGGVSPADMTITSWLPFYHDMGLVLGVCAPVLGGFRTVLTSPVSFLARPARWMQMLAKNTHPFSAAPNFAFELAARKTSNDDLAGMDLGDVLVILSGSERVHPTTLKRFNDRFARFNFPDKAIRPSYGLAEATVYAATRTPANPPEVVEFDSEKLSAGNAQRCATGSGTPLVSYGVTRSPIIRIVDPETRVECPEGTAGEIWMHGENVALGYWQKPDETEHTFHGRLESPADGLPTEGWLRTGDRGFFSDGEMFIIGRIKDLLIVYGRNHSPDDIEATIQEITGGRCAAIGVSDHHTEKLVVIIEFKKRGDSHEDAMERFAVVKRESTSAISNSHGISVADLVLVDPGSIPITTSGKVRRAACVEQYRNDDFVRLDA